MRFYATEELSANQALSPEGFLICYNVPVARVGTQLYAKDEVPVDANADGIIRIERDPDEVFKAESIASYAGKPLVDEHPTEDDMGVKVTPENWQKFVRGVVLNPRRGDGIQFNNDFIYADFTIYDPEAIAAVRDGKREVSVGYDADYEQLEPGHGRQKDIICNHVALVDKGRCGPRCAIGDQAMSNRLNKFRASLRRFGVRDEAGVLNAVAELEKEPEALGEVITDAMEAGLLDGGRKVERDDGKHHIEINLHGMGGKEPMRDAVEEPVPAAGAAGGGEAAPAWAQSLMQRLGAIEQTLVMLAQAEEDEVEEEEPAGGGGPSMAEEEEPTGDEDLSLGPHGDMDVREAYTNKGAAVPSLPKGEGGTADRRAPRRAAVGDSTSLRLPFNDMVSRAEILAPGITFPTFDTGAPARFTSDAMCSFRRQTLHKAWGENPAAKEVIGGLLAQTGAKADFLDKRMTCDSIAALFGGASQVLRDRTSHRIASTRTGSQGGANNGTKAAASPADINARNASYWKDRGGAAA